MSKLSELQINLLALFKWFHEFCEENNLVYYMLGGTMLGAARHHGFIPWDDDIDVGMPRNYYEEFLSLTKNRVFGNYVVEGIDTENNDFFYGYAKIYDTNTTLIENTRYKIKRGIYIDVFPLDGVSNDESKIESVFYPIFNRYQFLLARTCAIRKERAWYKNFAIYAARAIPNFVASNKKLMIQIDELCKQKSYEECSFVCNYYGNWGKREIMKKSVMGTPTLYQFEDMRAYGAEDYDSYLTNLYSDWRALPPEDKRITHHDYILCDLTKSYLK